MSWIWQNSPSKGVELLIELAIADFANDEGEAYPSIDSIARKSRASRRYVIDTIKGLTEAGRLNVVEGGGVNGTNRYTFVDPVGGAFIAPPKRRRGVHSETQGGAIYDKGGVQSSGAILHPIRNDPSLRTVEEPGGTRARRVSRPRQMDLQQAMRRYRKDANA